MLNRMLTCPLAAGKVLCSKKDKDTKVIQHWFAFKGLTREYRTVKDNEPAVLSEHSVHAWVFVENQICVLQCFLRVVENPTLDTVVSGTVKHVQLVCVLFSCRGVNSWGRTRARSADLYLHEVNAVWSLEERLYWAQEFFCFLALLVELQDLLGVFPHIHGESALQHLHRFSLVRLQQRMHPLILGPYSLLQFRHWVLCTEHTHAHTYTYTHLLTPILHVKMNLLTAEKKLSLWKLI